MIISEYALLFQSHKRKKCPASEEAGLRSCQCLCLDFHAAGHREHDVILAVHREVVNQAAPERLVEFRHHLRQLLHRQDEPLQFPPADALGGDVGGDLLILGLGVLEAGCQSVVVDNEHLLSAIAERL